MHWHHTFLDALQELCRIYRVTPPIGGRLIGDITRPGHFAVITDPQFAQLASSPTALSTYIAFRADATSVLALADALRLPA